jgi:hypothetical protein
MKRLTAIGLASLCLACSSGPKPVVIDRTILVSTSSDTLRLTDQHGNHLGEFKLGDVVVVKVVRDSSVKREK